MTAGTPRITLDEAATRLGVHYMTVYRYVRTGRLPAEKVGRTWQVDPADLALLAGGEAVERDGATSDHATRFGARLVAGDEAGAWSVVEEALVNGRGPADVLVEIVGPAMVSVGERWHQGEVTMAEEHRATAVVTRIISRLGPRFARRGPARGVVILGAPAGDHHALPTSILRDLLRGEHFEVVDLGADVPAESWAEAAASAAAGAPSLVAVGIAVSTPDNDQAVRGAIDAVRFVTAVPVIVGGVGAAAHDTEQLDVRSTSSALDAVALISSLA